MYGNSNASLRTGGSPASYPAIHSRWRLWPLLVASLLAVALLQGLLWRRTRQLEELRAEVAGAALAALWQAVTRAQTPGLGPLLPAGTSSQPIHNHDDDHHHHYHHHHHHRQQQQKQQQQQVHKLFGSVKPPSTQQQPLRQYPQTHFGSAQWDQDIEGDALAATAAVYDNGHNSFSEVQYGPLRAVATNGAAAKVPGQDGGGGSHSMTTATVEAVARDGTVTPGEWTKTLQLIDVTTMMVQLPPRLILRTLCQSGIVVGLMGRGRAAAVSSATAATIATPTGALTPLPERLEAAVRRLCAQAERRVLEEEIGRNGSGVGVGSGGGGGGDGGGVRSKAENYPTTTATTARSTSSSKTTRSTSEVRLMPFESSSSSSLAPLTTQTPKSEQQQPPPPPPPPPPPQQQMGPLRPHRLQDAPDASSKGRRSGPSIFVGVFTSHNPGGKPTENSKYDYALRRAAARATWFGDSLRHVGAVQPDAGVAGDGVNGADGVVMVRFVAGIAANDAAAEEALSQEAEAHGDFFRLPGLQECYECLSNKTRAFFSAVLEAYPNVRWVVKADDDVYLIPQRLPAAAAQWEQIGAGYIGCMKNGWVVQDPGQRWYEPHHLLLGSYYFLHAYGSAYVLSSEVVRRVIIRNYHDLRLLANEDTSVGAWMLAQDVVFFEDMRLCSSTCHKAALVVWRTDCAGLCAPLEDMEAMHRNETCRARHDNPLAYMPSYHDHVAFEKLWV